MTTRTLLRSTAALTGAVLAIGLAHVPIQAATVSTSRSPPASRATTPSWAARWPLDIDQRGATDPTSAQLAAAKTLTAGVRWNRYGTPASISPLAATSAPPRARPRPPPAAGCPRTPRCSASARHRWPTSTVNSQKLVGSDARAVLFRQRFGALAPAVDGLVTVGVGNRAIQYVSSSLSRSTSAPAAPVLTATAAWLKAAATVGQHVSASDIGKVVTQAGWSRFKVSGLAQEQMSRLRAVAFANGSVRPAFETNVIDVAGGSASAYTVLVDALTGAVVRRQNMVDSASDSFQFQGAVTATQCGPKHAFEIKDDKSTQISAVAAEANTLNDITIKLFSPTGALLTTGDTAHQPRDGDVLGCLHPPGVYSMQVCPFADPDVPFTAPRGTTSPASR